MARLERFKSVFDEFQDGFDRGFDRQVKLATLVQNARAQFAQEQRQRTLTNLEVSKYNMLEPFLQAAETRKLALMQKYAPELDYYNAQRTNAIAQTSTREAQLQEALQRNDFAKAKEVSGGMNWRRNNTTGRIEQSFDNQNWFAGGVASDIIEGAQDVSRATQKEQYNQIMDAGSERRSNNTPQQSVSGTSVIDTTLGRGRRPDEYPSDPMNPLYPEPGIVRRSQVAASPVAIPSQIGAVGASTAGDPIAPLIYPDTVQENPYLGKGRRYAEGGVQAGDVPPPLNPFDLTIGKGQRPSSYPQTWFPAGTKESAKGASLPYPIVTDFDYDTQKGTSYTNASVGYIGDQEAIQATVGRDDALQIRKLRDMLRSETDPNQIAMIRARIKMLQSGQ
jgi:hypothetical protein